jgi:hypothetical protein
VIVKDTIAAQDGGQVRCDFLDEAAVFTEKDSAIRNLRSSSPVFIESSLRARREGLPLGDKQECCRGGMRMARTALPNGNQPARVQCIEPGSRVNTGDNPDLECQVSGRGSKVCWP